MSQFKNYEAPELALKLLANADVICTSGGGTTQNTGGVVGGADTDVSWFKTSGSESTVVGL